MVLVQKGPCFQLFFFGQYRPGKCLLRYSRTKNSSLGYKKKNFKKSKNWHFSKGVNPGFCSKKWPFFQLFFSGNIDQENVCYDILERKNAFLGYKKIGSKSRKIDIFLKGLTHSFGLKMAIFPTFFF